MKLSVLSAALLAAAAVSACASNEPTPPEPPGNATPTAKTCEHGGKTHAVGASFPSADGCNTCSCTETGVACTERACAPGPGPTAAPVPPGSAAACSPDNEPNREYRIRNPDECKAALFRCDAGKKPFFNACGCGCE